jgi:archaellum component FlaC
MNREIHEVSRRQPEGRALRRKLLPAAGMALLVFTVGCEAGEQDQARIDEAVSATEFRTTMNELRLDLRSTLDQFGSQIADLDERYQSSTEELSQDWQDTRDEMREYRQKLEADLARLEMATVDEADGLKDDIAESLEELTHRVERAQLVSIEGGEEFVEASQERLTRLEQDLRTLEREAPALSVEVRETATQSMRDFNARMGELRVQLDDLLGASAEQISDEREEIAEDIGSLTASVKRELFEVRQSVTTTTSMRN